MGALEKIRKHQAIQNEENDRLAEKCRRIYARQVTKFEHGLHDPHAASSSDVEENFYKENFRIPRDAISQKLVKSLMKKQF